MSPRHCLLHSPCRRLQHLSALALIYSCLLLQIQADTADVCANAADNLLNNLALEEPSRYSAESCETAPATTVCDITSTVGPCLNLPACESISTRIDSTCTPENEATGCCTTFLALPCPGCPPIPLACLQFCFDTSAISDAAPAVPANTTAPQEPAEPEGQAPGPVPPAPAPVDEESAPLEEGGGLQTADPAPGVPVLASVSESSADADLTPTGMPRQIIVKTINGASALPQLPMLCIAVTALAVATTTLHSAWL